jgi:type I restriction enzyme S subunit
MLSDLTAPESWSVKRLAECVDVLDSQRIPVNSKERASRIGPVPYYGATGQVGWIDDYLFNEELVLLGEDGAPFLDKSKPIAYIIDGKSWVNNHAHVLRARSSITSNRYIKYYLDSFNFTDYVQGSTRDKLTQGAMNSIPVMLAPRPLQDALVDIIESVASKRASAAAHLTTARRAIERFRQAILAAASSGRLTADWREANGYLPAPHLNVGTRKRPRQFSSIDSYDLAELPDGWTWVQVDDLLPAGGIFDGPFGSNLRTSDYTDYGARVVRLENIGHLRFIGEKRTYVSLEKYRQLAKHEVSHGDIMFSSFVDDQMRVCVLPPDVGTPTIAKADCFTLRPINEVNRFYLALQLASPATFKALSNAVHGATRPRVNTTQVRSVPVPLCSIEEQREIVNRYQSALAIMDATERRLQEASRRLDLSSQAVLAKAFRGELMPTEAEQESAEGAA